MEIEQEGQEFETRMWRNVLTGEMEKVRVRVRRTHRMSAGPTMSKLLTRQMLMDYGVEDVAEDGTYVIVNGKERKPMKADGYGYRAFCLGGHILLAHRLVYAWFHGECKAGLVIDHLNACRDDNRLENLQEITHAENSRLKGDHTRTLLDPEQNC